MYATVVWTDATTWLTSISQQIFQINFLNHDKVNAMGEIPNNYNNHEVLLSYPITNSKPLTTDCCNTCAPLAVNHLTIITATKNKPTTRGLSAARIIRSARTPIDCQSLSISVWCAKIYGAIATLIADKWISAGVVDRNCGWVNFCSS